jgi:hypothetical protein
MSILLLTASLRVTQLQRPSDREELASLVAAGKHVTVLGSSWNAIELANHLRYRIPSTVIKVWRESITQDMPMLYHVL